MTNSQLRHKVKAILNTWSYHDSTDEHGATLDEYEAKAGEQDRAILHFFRLNHTQSFTPCQVYAIHSQWPITSIRRAITNLTNAGYLQKGKDKVKGMYGRNTHQWSIHPNYKPIPRQLKLF